MGGEVVGQQANQLMDEDEHEEEEKMDIISELDSTGDRGGVIGFRAFGRLGKGSVRSSRSNSSRGSKKSSSRTSKQSEEGVQVIDDFESDEDEEGDQEDRQIILDYQSNNTNIKRVQHMGTLKSNLSADPENTMMNRFNTTRSNDHNDVPRLAKKQIIDLMSDVESKNQQQDLHSMEDQVVSNRIKVTRIIDDNAAGSEDTKS